MCVILHAEEGAGLVQRKALASAVIVHPPLERPSLSLHRQLSAPFLFLGGGEGQEELKQAVGKFKKSPGRHLTILSAPSICFLFFFSPCPSRGILAVGGGLGRVLELM